MFSFWSPAPPRAYGPGDDLLNPTHPVVIQVLGLQIERGLVGNRRLLADLPAQAVIAVAADERAQGPAGDLPVAGQHGRADQVDLHQAVPGVILVVIHPIRGDVAVGIGDDRRVDRAVQIDLAHLVGGVGVVMGFLVGVGDAVAVEVAAADHAAGRRVPTGPVAEVVQVPGDLPGDGPGRWRLDGGVGRVELAHLGIDQPVQGVVGVEVRPVILVRRALVGPLIDAGIPPVAGPVIGVLVAVDRGLGGIQIAQIRQPPEPVQARIVPGAVHGLGDAVGQAHGHPPGGAGVGIVGHAPENRIADRGDPPQDAVNVGTGSCCVQA